MAFNIYKWRRDQLLTENNNSDGMDKEYNKKMLQQLLDWYKTTPNPEPDAIKRLEDQIALLKNKNLDGGNIMDEFKSKFNSATVSSNQRGDMTPSEKLPYDIKAKFNFKWGRWDDVKEQETAITNFFKEKGYSLVDSFEFDDDERRASLTLYYKKD
jgi:hypothetical protein